MLKINQSFILLSLVCYSQLAAASWFDKGSEQLQRLIFSDNPTQYAKAKPLTVGLPAEYRYSFFRETVFNSEVAVVEAGSEHQQTVLLVHGLGNLGFQDWFNVIPHLAKNYHVLALDLPGFAHSGQPQGRYNMTNYAKVLQQLLQHYKHSQQAIVIGHSMGGAVSLSFASLYPELTKQLIIVDGAGILNKTAFIKGLANIPEFNADIPFDYQKYLMQINDVNNSFIERSVMSDKVSELLQRNDLLWHSTVASSPNLNAALSLVEEDFSKVLRQLDESIAVDLIWGEKDGIAPLRTGKVVANVRKSASLQVIEGAGHVPMKSHTSVFLSMLDAALYGDLKAYRQPVPYSLVQDELSCRDQSSKSFFGSYYKKIILENCHNVHFTQVKADQIIIKNSTVTFEQLTVAAKGIAIQAQQSVVTITNAEISAENAIKSSGSRFDIAGVNFNTPLLVDNGKNPSKFIFSLSTLNNQLTLHTNKALQKNTQLK